MEMRMEWCKEAWAWILVAVEVHHSTVHANQDKQVGHNQVSWGGVVDVAEVVDMGGWKQAHGMEVLVEAEHKTDSEYTQVWSAVEGVGMEEFGYVKHWACSQDLFAVGA